MRRWELQFAYLDFVDNVECVFIASIGEDDFYEGIGHSVGSRGGGFEGVLKVCSWVLDCGVAAKDDEAGNRDAIALLVVDSQGRDVSPYVTRSKLAT